MASFVVNKLRSRKNLPIGQIEQIILFAILHRLNHAYSIDIKDEIQNRSGINLTIGALYSTLDRMVKKELITFQDIDVENSKVKSRKCFSVSNKGRQLLRETIDITEKMQGQLDIENGLYVTS